LKDENLNLKRHQQELENDVKIISTQLRRMVEQLKSDKIIVGKAAHFERQLDELIEQQVLLKDQ
jgi:undecaprenyl pyrophosphate synthase